MGRARGNTAAVGAIAGTRRGALRATPDDGPAPALGNHSPLPGTSSRATELLIADVHRGEFDLALGALSLMPGRLRSAPLAAEVLDAVAQTAASLVRAGAEAQLAERCAHQRTAFERRQLKDTVAADVADELTRRIDAGEPVSAHTVRLLAADAAARSVELLSA